MNASRAKAERREERRRVRERIAQAHDRLHKDDVDGAHQHLHAALGLDHDVTLGEPLTHRERFDQEFRGLVTRHGVRAAFVLADTVDATTGRARLLSGGDAELCQIVDEKLRA